MLDDVDVDTHIRLRVIFDSHTSDQLPIDLGPVVQSPIKLILD